MKLIVGLGNPGKEYEKTRHNSGFLAMDILADMCNISISTNKFNALIGQTRIGMESVILMKPLTYMNLSSQAVSQIVAYYHIDPSDILVLHDDMDIPVGSVRIRKKGSSGGQKGMRSIIQALQTEEIARIRIGVGHDSHGNVPDYVLSAVPKSQQADFQNALEISAKAAYAWVNEPLEIVMSKYNVKKEKSE